MNQSSLTTTIIEKLVSVGYEKIETPFRVASVEFEFTAALKGPVARGLDLILVLDTSIGKFDETNGNRVQTRLETLGRALDVVGSKFAMTAILSGAPLPSEVVERVGNVCRVLNIMDHYSTDELSEEDTVEIFDQIRMLLPLEINSGTSDDVFDLDPLSILIDRLPKSINQKFKEDVFKASTRNSTEFLRLYQNTYPKPYRRCLMMNNHLLKSIDIENFRSIKGHIHAPLDAKVVLVHGENGAGKTSLLSAIELGLTGGIQSLERADRRYKRQLLHRDCRRSAGLSEIITFETIRQAGLRQLVKAGASLTEARELYGCKSLDSIAAILGPESHKV